MATIDRFKCPEFNISYTKTQDPAKREFSMHIHDSFEILCFVSGNAEYMVEGKIYDLRPGCIMIMRSAETHKLIVNTNEPYERYIINFYPEMLIQLGFTADFFNPFTERNLGEKNLYLASEFPEIPPEKLFGKMLAECKYQNPKRAALANLACLLSAINTAFEEKKQNYFPEKPNTSDEIIDYINENLFADLSLTSISETLHISPSQINRIFRKLTGTSVYNYIISKRLIVAQERIAKGENSTTASQNCGFHDYSSFYRLYKKHFGTAPTQAKKKIQSVN